MSTLGKSAPVPPADRLFGQIAVRMGLMTVAQLNECVALQRREETPARIGEVAQELGFLDEEQLTSILDQQKRVHNQRQATAVPGQDAAPPSSLEAPAAFARIATQKQVAAGGLVEEVNLKSGGRQIPDRQIRQSEHRAHAVPPPSNGLPPVAEALELEPPTSGVASAPHPGIQLQPPTVGDPDPFAPISETGGGAPPVARSPRAGAATRVAPAELDTIDLVDGPPSAGLLEPIQESPNPPTSSAFTSNQVAAPAAVAPAVPEAPDFGNVNLESPPAPSVSVNARTIAGMPAPLVAQIPADAPTRTSAPPPAPAPKKNEAAGHSVTLPNRAQTARLALGDKPLLARALAFSMKHGASDVHVHCGVPIMARIHGRLFPMKGGKVVHAKDAMRMVAQILTDEQWEVLGTNGQLDFAYALDGLGRFRVNAFRQLRGMDIVFRIIPPGTPTLARLNLPASLEQLTEHRTGLVLCTGPAGCGKSATMSALINALHASRAEHILTVENPIENVFGKGRCMINQREVGMHTTSFSRALRAALREDPDVIVITELRDRETIQLALTAAETGHLVLGTLHTGSAASTISRLVNTFPAEEQGHIRTMVSDSLRAVVSQVLVPKADGKGRIPAIELLIVTNAVSNLIRDDKPHQLPSLMVTGRSLGMVTLDDSLERLVSEGEIRNEDALKVCTQKDRFGGKG